MGDDLNSTLVLILLSVAGFSISCGLCPLIIRICLKKGWFDPVNARKVHTGNIPRLGGIAIFSSFIPVIAAYIAIVRPFDVEKFLLLGIGGIVIYGIGVWDDLKDLPAKLKLFFQIIAALCVAISPFYLDTFLFYTVPAWLGRFLTFMWVLLLMNAYNLIDGLDWLCSGLCLFAFITLAIASGMVHDLSFPFIVLMIACLLGFMVWNKPDAKIFLGDCGSQTLGYVIAVLPFLITENESFEGNKLIISLLLSSVPTIDVLAAVIRRTRDKRPVFSSDRAHIHHKLINIGFTKISAVTLLWAIQISVSMVIILSLLMHTLASAALLFVTYAFVFGFFITIHYINLRVNLRFQGMLSNASEEEK